MVPSTPAGAAIRTAAVRTRLLGLLLATQACLAPVLVAGCSDQGQVASPESPAASMRVRTEDYLPGLAADVHLPRSGAPRAAVVLVPGGGWSSADPAGLAPLAESLAPSGYAAVTITYRTAADGARFPRPVEDVACAVSWAASHISGQGSGALPVVILGHSAGAQLAALAALDPTTFVGNCPSTPVSPAGLVGLAGPYDIEAFGGPAEPLFGLPLERDPSAWAKGNPIRLAANVPELPVLLIHGGADDLVPVAFTEAFTDALRAGGHQVTLKVIDGVGHQGIYLAAVSASTIRHWLASQVTQL